jgi:hypothetical protein
LSEVWFLHFLLRQAQIMCALGNGVLLFEAVWGLCVPGLIRRLQLSIQSVIRSSARSFSLLHCYCTATLYFPGRPIDRCQKCPRVANVAPRMNRMRTRRRSSSNWHCPHWGYRCASRC